MKYLKHLDTYQNALNHTIYLDVNNDNYVISNNENDIVLYNKDCGEYFYIGYEEINEDNYTSLGSKVINFENIQNFNLTNPDEFTDYVYILLRNNKTISEIKDTISQGIISQPELIGQFKLYNVYKTLTQVYGQITITFNEIE